MKFIINLSFIKTKNGLWFYSLDLIEYLSKNHDVIVFCNQAQSLHFKEHNIRFEIFNILSYFKYLFLGYIFITTNMRPVLYPKSFFVVHDLFPLNQPSTMKRVVSKIIFKCGSFFSNCIVISNHHSVLLSSELILPNKPLIYSNPSKLICDAIVFIGTETSRKNFGLLNKFLSSNKNFYPEHHLVVFGTQEIIMDRDFTFVNSRELFDYKFENCVYLSLSSDEGFNRGSSLFSSAGLPLFLSDIPAHREFYPNANFIDLDTCQINTGLSDAKNYNIQIYDSITHATLKKLKC